MEKDQIQQLMLDLAKDLVTLENIPDLDPELIEKITEAYQEIYNDLAEIRKM